MSVLHSTVSVVRVSDYLRERVLFGMGRLISSSQLNAGWLVASVSGPGSAPADTCPSKKSKKIYIYLIYSHNITFSHKMNIILNVMFILLQSWLFLFINFILIMTFLFEKLQFYFSSKYHDFFFWKVQLYSNDFFSDNYWVLTISLLFLIK